MPREWDDKDAAAFTRMRMPSESVLMHPQKKEFCLKMDSIQLQWAAIFAVATLGVALLIYDIKNKKVPARFVTEDVNVKLKIEEVSRHLSFFRRRC